MPWETVLLFVVMAGLLHLLLYTAITGISPVPTSRPVRRALLDRIPRELDGPIVEAGSGWGALAIALADRHPACPVTAYELSPIPWAYSRLRLLLRPRPNLTIHRANFLDASFEGVRVVVCYLYPGGMRALRPKLERELPRDALVLSNTFPVPGWEPRLVVEPVGDPDTPVYVYSLPDACAGDRR